MTNPSPKQPGQDMTTDGRDAWVAASQRDYTRLADALRARGITEWGDTVTAVLAEIDRLEARVGELEKALKSSPECWHFNNESREEFMERYWAWRSAALEGKK